MADLIKREHIIKVLEDAKRSAYEHWDIDTGNAFEEAINLVKNIPTIEAEPVKHGRWEKNGEVLMFGDVPVKCSQCGFKTIQDALHRLDYHYCPNCGARMDEVEK